MDIMAGHGLTRADSVMYFPNGKYMTKELQMRGMAGNPVALDLLEVQRNRLADRLRTPWWYLAGSAIAWAVGSTDQFSLRYLSRADYWAIGFAELAVWCLLQWGLARATGIIVGPRPLRVLRDGLFYYRPGRPALIAILVVTLALGETEFLLIRHGLLAVAIVVAALGVVIQVALQQAWLRGIRQALRDGGRAA
jgi:hypothetical protein